MKSAQKPSSFDPGIVAFDLLRARLESEVKRPAVIAITSCTADDGQDITARKLAYSFATAGHVTLFVDTSLSNTSLASPSPGLAIEEIGRRQKIPDAATGNLAALALNDATLQETTGQRGMHSWLDILRSKFDYVVITTQHGAPTAFATTAIDSADAVIACVKMGRRRTADDTKFADALDRLGTRYLGIVALDPSIMLDDAVTSVHGPVVPPRRAESVQLATEHKPREMAKSPK